MRGRAARSAGLHGAGAPLGVVEALREILASGEAETIRLQMNLAENLPKVAADATQLMQVFATLISNARESMLPDGGTIDADGCYWMAGVGGWQLVRFTPAGKVDMIIDMPVEKPSKIAFGGADLASLSAGRMRRMRTRMQMVFQDPYGSLHPRHTVDRILSEPVAIHRLGQSAARVVNRGSRTCS